MADIVNISDFAATSQPIATDYVSRNSTNEHQQVVKVGLGAESAFTGFLLQGQQTAANSLSAVLSSDNNVVTPRITHKRVQTTYTRPANTTTYTANAVLCNSTSAGTILTFSGMALANAGFGKIYSAILREGANQTLKLESELWLFRSSITMQNDNVAFAPSAANLDDCIGVIAFSAGASKTGTVTAGASGNNLYAGLLPDSQPLAYTTGASDTNLYGVLVVRNAYVPVSAETFSVTLLAEQHG